MVCDAKVPSEHEINKIRVYFEEQSHSGNLEYNLREKMEKQRRAYTKSGPHPHHQPDEPLRQVTQARGGSFYQQRYQEQRGAY